MVDFEKQFENVDSATELYQDITSSATAVSTPQDARVKLMVARELGYATMGSNVLKAEILPRFA